MVVNIFWFIPKALKTRIKRTITNFIDHSKTINSLEALVESNQIKITQLEESLRLYNGLITPPPEPLQRRIVGGFYNDFVRSGYKNIHDFNLALSKYGKQLSDFHSVLDFGCGCGRILRALHTTYPDLKISGSDIDTEAITYCKQYLGEIGTFLVNRAEAPSFFTENSFDFIYGISVFTHLPEPLQLEWLSDLQRISKPGAYLILTIENEKNQKHLNATQQQELNDKGIYYIDFGTTDGLPEFYKTTLHTHDYVKKVWGGFFEILDIIPLGSENHQDLVVCKKR